MNRAITTLWVLAIGLPLSLLARVGRGDGRAAVLVEATDAGLASISPAGSQPDPAPLVTRHQWVLDLAYRSGALSFGGARRVELAKPIATPRLMGRFALELYVGKELLDRVRFDFPLFGADELVGSRFDAPPSFERKLSTNAAVMMPHSERATRAVLVDRASGRVWQLPWPLVARPDAGPDGG